MRVQTEGAFSFTPLVQRPTGWCAPTLHIDGFPADYEQLRTYAPEELVGLEVYTRAATAPARYSLRPVGGATGAGPSGTHVDCGLVLVWTKQARW